MNWWDSLAEQAQSTYQSTVNYGKQKLNEAGKAVSNASQTLQKKVDSGMDWVDHHADSMVDSFEHSSVGNNAVGHALGEETRDTVHFDTGVVSGATTLVSGTGQLVGGAAQYATDQKFREHVNNTARYVATHPGKVAGTVWKQGVSAFKADPYHATGELAGMIIPAVLTGGAGAAGDAVDGANVASKAGEAAEIAEDGASAASKAGDVADLTEEAANGASKTGEAAQLTKAENPITRYANLKADDFTGPDDPRLQEVSDFAKQQNRIFKGKVEQDLNDTGIDYSVEGRAKKPASIYNKLVTDNSSIGDLKDLSGVRINLDVAKPNFEEYYQAHDVLTTENPDSALPGRFKDTIANPKENGYTGRLHNNFVDDEGTVHEVQIGSNDLSNFIDRKLVRTDGSKISLHDAIYKGDNYGVQVPENLQTQYKGLMQEITGFNGQGGNLASNPELEQKINDFAGQVTNYLK